MKHSVESMNATYLQQAAPNQYEQVKPGTYHGNKMILTIVQST